MKTRLLPAALFILTSFALVPAVGWSAPSDGPAIQKIASVVQEEGEPIIFVLTANGLDEQTVWQLVGKTDGGEPVSVTAASADLKDPSTWEIVFPGMLPGRYHIEATDPLGNQTVIPDALVVTVHSPVLADVTPRKVDAGTPFVLTLAGKSIPKGSKVELLPAQGRGTPGTLKVLNQEATSFSLSFPGLEPGQYTLRVTSPEAKQSTLPSVLTVLAPAPVASGLNTGERLGVATVTAANLTDKMKVSLVAKGKSIEVRTLERTKTGLVILYPADLAPGSYDLVLTNDEGKTGTLKGALVVPEQKRTELPPFWAGAGTGVLFPGPTSYSPPELSLGMNFCRKPGLQAGVEAGLNAFNLRSADGSISFDKFHWALSIDEWFGWSLVEPDGLFLMGVRIPFGMEWGPETVPFTGLIVDYELNIDWGIEWGLYTTLGSSLSPSSTGLSVLRYL